MMTMLIIKIFMNIKQSIKCKAIKVVTFKEMKNRVTQIFETIFINKKYLKEL